MGTDATAAGAACQSERGVTRTGSPLYLSQIAGIRVQDRNTTPMISRVEHGPYDPLVLHVSFH